MPSKERQEKYREIRKRVGDTRLCIWIPSDCKDALQEVTDYLNVTQKHFIERLIKQAATILSSSTNAGD